MEDLDMITYTDRITDDKELLEKISLLLENNCLDQVQHVTQHYAKFSWDSDIDARLGLQLLGRFNKANH